MIRFKRPGWLATIVRSYVHIPCDDEDDAVVQGDNGERTTGRICLSEFNDLCLREIPNIGS